MFNLVLCWSYVAVHCLIGGCRIGGFHFSVVYLGQFPVGFGFRGKFSVMEEMPRNWTVLVAALVWLPFFGRKVFRFLRRKGFSFFGEKVFFSAKRFSFFTVKKILRRRRQEMCSLLSLRSD